ncbi:hypothetical protein NE237_008689 [Protea cynaroides]|uniref:Uncharacterized protein n=1 Tax=Protea cynaroides TaxID=273540 RepID=A0A9Q0QZX5_9MAGN|nr:hypothetical protein NE237_008689 [Protea cynaroides]
MEKKHKSFNRAMEKQKSFRLVMEKQLSFCGAMEKQKSFCIAMERRTDGIPSLHCYAKAINGDKQLEKLEQKLDEQPPNLRNDKSVQDDVFLQVMGPERNGRVRGAGKAVAPSDVGLARSNVQKKKEDEKLQATISNMQGEINDLKEQLTEMDQIKTQLTEMDQMKAQMKEMDQLKVQLTQMDQMKTQIAFLTQAFTGETPLRVQFIYVSFTFQCL